VVLVFNHCLKYHRWRYVPRYGRYDWFDTNILTIWPRRNDRLLLILLILVPKKMWLISIPIPILIFQSLL